MAISKAKVILTSDDFGMSAVYNNAMLHAVQSGWLSSVSVMVERNLKVQHKQLETLIKLYAEKQISLGLHLEIIMNQDISEQCFCQWNKFLSLLGDTPDYVDIHKDHLYKAGYDQVAAFCLEKAVPFRKYKETSLPVRSPYDTLLASFLEVGEIIQRIRNIKGEEPIEIVFHIGKHDEDVISSLNKERENDMHKLILVNEELHNTGASVINYKMLM